ncbi:MAG: hypothetical protein HZB44_00610 [Actinobacteria bacterium]|nr:hypothetical protein [Actinomycetota bacterium]
MGGEQAGCACAFAAVINIVTKLSKKPAIARAAKAMPCNTADRHISITAPRGPHEESDVGTACDVGILPDINALLMLSEDFFGPVQDRE